MTPPRSGSRTPQEARSRASVTQMHSRAGKSRPREPPRSRLPHSGVTRARETGRHSSLNRGTANEGNHDALETETQPIPGRSGDRSDRCAGRVRLHRGEHGAGLERGLRLGRDQRLHGLERRVHAQRLEPAERRPGRVHDLAHNRNGEGAGRVGRIVVRVHEHGRQRDLRDDVAAGDRRRPSTSSPSSRPSSA